MRDQEKPVLKPGVLYLADNGQMICLHCAGVTAKYTGRDISGRRVEEMTAADVRYFESEVGRCQCEEGCTTVRSTHDWMPLHETSAQVQCSHCGADRVRPGLCVEVRQRRSIRSAASNGFREEART